MRTAIVFVCLVGALTGERRLDLRVEYIGGTISQFRVGSEAAMSTADPGQFQVAMKGSQVEVPYARVNLLEYGQNVNRRLALAVVISPMFLLSKARKHFLTVGYQDAEGQQQAMVFRLDKKNVRAVLASMEARTGLKVQFQDDEARKAGKG
ncbi:MAG: hypothetical protein U0Q16_12345 [Bryobacteraceae bacterium]